MHGTTIQSTEKARSSCSAGVLCAGCDCIRQASCTSKCFPNATAACARVLLWEISPQRTRLAWHLVYEEGGFLCSLHQLVTGASVPAEHQLPACLPFQHSCIGMRTVHHQHRLQCLQAQLSLHSRDCRLVLWAHLTHIHRTSHFNGRAYQLPQHLQCA